MKHSFNFRVSNEGSSRITCDLDLFSIVFLVVVNQVTKTERNVILSNREGRLYAYLEWTVKDHTIRQGTLSHWTSKA